MKGDWGVWEAGGNGGRGGEEEAFDLQYYDGLGRQDEVSWEVFAFSFFTWIVGGKISHYGTSIGWNSYRTEPAMIGN